jgi:hypothetical protein
MSSVYGFDEQSARRIAKTVRRVESYPTGNADGSPNGNVGLPFFLAVIVDKPDGDSYETFEDNRYYLVSCECINKDNLPTTVLSYSAYETTASNYFILTATNMNEAGNSTTPGTHLLPCGKIVQVFSETSRKSPGVTRYYFAY